MSLDFEQRYRDHPDPWGYETSAYEQAKFAATVDACGPGPFAHALELGGSIGVLSALLAPRCRRLTTIDLAPTAVAIARGRLAGHPDAVAAVGEIPHDIPEARFDLVVCSEVLYYLERKVFEQTLETLRERAAPAGRLVAVHYLPTGPERPLSAAEVHATLRAATWLRPCRSEENGAYVLDVFEVA